MFSALFVRLHSISLFFLITPHAVLLERLPAAKAWFTMMLLLPIVFTHCGRGCDWKLG
jgi:hypothetical protein